MIDSVYDTHELKVNLDGLGYTVIYGYHINGGFIAIPGWNICCEADGNFIFNSTVDYNTSALIKAGLKSVAARAIAEAIQEHYIASIKAIDSAGKTVWRHFGNYHGNCYRDGNMIAWYSPGIDGMAYLMRTDGCSIEGKTYVVLKGTPEEIEEAAERTMEDALSMQQKTTTRKLHM